MTVKELIEKLSTYPPNFYVYIFDDWSETSFDISRIYDSEEGYENVYIELEDRK